MGTREPPDCVALCRKPERAIRNGEGILRNFERVRLGVNKFDHTKSGLELALAAGGDHNEPVDRNLRDKPPARGSALHAHVAQVTNAQLGRNFLNRLVLGGSALVVPVHVTRDALDDASGKQSPDCAAQRLPLLGKEKGKVARAISTLLAGKAIERALGLKRLQGTLLSAKV